MTNFQYTESQAYSLNSPLRRQKLTPQWIRRLQARKYVQRANAAREDHSWPKAALSYRDALRYVPQRYDLWVQYGHALKETGLLIDAEAAYRHALEINPQAPDTYLQIGHVLKLQSRHHAARNAYLRAYELDPHLPSLAAEL